MNDTEHITLLRNLKHTAAVFLALLYLDRPTSEVEISKLLEINPETTRRHLHSLAKSGLITRAFRYSGWILTVGGRQLVLPAANVNTSAENPRSYAENQRSSAENPRSPLKLRESDRELTINLDNSLTDSLNLTADSEKSKLLAKLRSAGVYLKTAQDLVERFDDTSIELHLDYYRYALGKNLAQGPGWLVLSLKEDWQAPIGFVPNWDHSPSCKCEACRAASTEKYREWEQPGK
jgi:hypothetical protein